ncbi:YTH domain family protein [Ceratobasidium sp. AG-Ba]|nr:YTH domain family protein [Ceratobasidium sp. AG-Ba]
MAGHEVDHDWIREVGPPRVTEDDSPCSTKTAIQEPDRRPPGVSDDHQAPHGAFLLQKHTSLPSPPLEYHLHHSDPRSPTDPSGGHYFPLLDQAALAEPSQSRPRASPPLNIAPRPVPSTRSNSSESKHGLTKQLLLTPIGKPNIPSPSDCFSQDIWHDLSAPGAVLFSTGPIMAKPAGTASSEADAGRTGSIDGALWGAPSGLPSSNPASDTTYSQDRASNLSSGYTPDPASLVYTTGQPASNSGTHTYPGGYPPYSSNPPYGASSPRNPVHGPQSVGGQHGQTTTYPNSGSGHPYANYRPNMPYSGYPPYQGASGYGQFHGSSISGNYPNSPPATTYHGSPVAGGYPSPTGAYGMQFAPYGMVSGPPMYAPTTYAHAPYGHPYLPQQSQSDDNQGSGTWWFMPAGSGSGGYGAQPQQAPYVQRFSGPQQPPLHQSQPAMLNPTSPHMQQISIPGYPSHAAVHSPTAHALPATGPISAHSPSSPQQMYAAFGAMGLQPSAMAPQPAPAGRYLPPLSLPASGLHPAVTSPVAPSPPGALSPTRPLSSSKGGRASAASKTAGAGSRVTSPATTRRPWHPNPPVARSEWVMWVGNVPSDATHDELWTFFNQDTTAREPSAATGSGRTLLPPTPADPIDGSNATSSHGVSSVFLISRSNCAFVNYEEETYLTRAVSFFNGRPLRPHDPRCPRLVCRVRRKDDDLRAGVGGQRGMGLHARWIQDQERRAGEDDKKDDSAAQDDPATSPSTYLGPASSSESSPPVAAAVDDVQRLPADVAGIVAELRDSTAAHQSGSASTNSSLLARHFPKRFFILKSLTQFDLNISVERGLWATQPHNEPTLDRAFRNSQDVYLIFSANKSGEWYGYARFVVPVITAAEGPIIKTQQSVNWESRVSPRSPTSPTNQRKADGVTSEQSSLATTQPGDSQHLQAPYQPIFSPSEHKFAASPAPITPGEAVKLQLSTNSPGESGISPSSAQLARADGLVSAPAELSEAHKQLANPASGSDETEPMDQPRRHTGAAAIIAKGNQSFELDGDAPYRALRETSEFGPSKQQESRTDEDGVVHKDTALTTDELERARNLSGDQPPRPIRESLTPAEANSSMPPVPGEEKVEGWGKPFKIKWIRTERLPFHRTRHLRNPWNNDREVKVSRDGTEVEPSVGQRLIDEWDNVVEPEPAPAVPASRHALPSRPGMPTTFGSAPPSSKPPPSGPSMGPPSRQ